MQGSTRDDQGQNVPFFAYFHVPEVRNGAEQMWEGKELHTN